MYRGNTEMYHCLMVLAVIGWCSAAIVPQDEKIDVNTSSDPSSQNIGVHSYSSVQGSQLPPTQYFYPTYPEYNSNGNALQSGYEGYLVPAGLLPQKNSHWITEIATTLLPFSSQALFYGARVGAYLFHLFFIIVLGGAFTTLICTFTPICTINFFGLGITKNQVKEQVTELARTYITPESVNAATVLVTKAIDKYTAMQREKGQGSMQGRTKRSSNPKNVHARK